LENFATEPIMIKSFR